MMDSRNTSQDKPAQRPETAPASQRVWICDRCGHAMLARLCKIICPNCGNRFDCSDLNLYFD